MRCLRFVAVLSAALLWAAAQDATASTMHSFGGGALTIELVTVGDPGNAPIDPPLPANYGTVPQASGAVGYEYEIGKYEMSANQATAVRDAGGPDLFSLGGSPWTGDQPISVDNWTQAAAFVNWLNENADDGPYPPAYKNVVVGGGGSGGNFDPWLPGDPGYDPANPFRNKLSKYALPSADEWTKAGYYDPTLNGGTGGYWDYAQMSNTQPFATAGGTVQNTAVYTGLDENGDKVGNYNGDGTVGDFANPVNAPADVDNAGGVSYYGTMAQEGNLFEWGETEWDLVNDTDPTAGTRMGNHGPSYNLTHDASTDTSPGISPDSFLGIGGRNRDRIRSTGLAGNLGFRIVAVTPAVPEPSTLLLTMAGAGLALARRRRA